MAENTQQQSGIACPACGTIEDYAGKKKIKNPDNSIKYRKECRACGSYFETVEIPLGIVNVQRRSRN